MSKKLEGYQFTGEADSNKYQITKRAKEIRAEGFSVKVVTEGIRHYIYAEDRYILTQRLKQIEKMLESVDARREDAKQAYDDRLAKINQFEIDCMKEISRLSAELKGEKHE